MTERLMEEDAHVESLDERHRVAIMILKQTLRGTAQEPVVDQLHDLWGLMSEQVIRLVIQRDFALRALALLSDADETIKIPDQRLPH